MSVTTTENRLYYNTVDILRDYDVHHTNAEEREPLDSTLNEHPIPEPASNPEGWPTDHRRVPPYRPVNRELNQEERAPFGRNVVEGTFIFLMLNGVRINSVSSTCSIRQCGNADVLNEEHIEGVASHGRSDQ